MSALSSFLLRSGRVVERGAHDVEKAEERTGGFWRRAKRASESAVGFGSDAASAVLDGRGGRLARLGAGLGAAGLAAYELEEIIKLIKFVGEFVHDPKGALSHLFGGKDEAKVAASPVAAGASRSEKSMLQSLPAGVGAKAELQAFEGFKAKMHEPGRATAYGPVAALETGPHGGGPRTIEEAYLRTAAVAERNGRPIVPGSIVEMEFMQNGKRSHVNVEAVDGKSFLPMAGENGHSQLSLPRGFATAEYAAGAAKRIEGARGAAIVAALGVPGGKDGFVTTGPAMMATMRADAQTAEAIKLAGVGVGIGGIGATQEVSGRRIGAPDDSVAVFASKGSVDGGRALRYEGGLVDGGRGSLVLSSQGQGATERTVMSAKSEHAGLSRMAVMTGSAAGLGGVGADGKIALSREGRESLHAVGEAAGRKLDVLLAGTEKLGAKRDSAVVIDRDSGRAVESVWSGNRMVTISDGRVDLVTKGPDGKLDVKSIADKEVGVDAKTGTSRLSPAALSAVSEFSRATAAPGGRIEAKDFMATLPPRAAQRGGGAGIGD